MFTPSPSPAPRLALIDDRERLRRKLLSASGELGRYWQNYLELAREGHRNEYEALPPLAWLVTGDPVYAEATRAVFLRLLRELPMAEESVEAQIHAYTVGAPLARFAVFLDWIWDDSILSEEERDALASQLVTQVYSSCYLRLKGRRPASDNQQTSMAFACALTGYIFGVKRGNSPAARRMGALGFRLYRTILEKIFDNGWCGEGSTYHHQVYCPVLALYNALIEEVTRRDYFNRRVGAGTVRDALRIAALTINEAGMLPGWDQYGNTAPELKTHLVYLARRDRTAWPLELIGRHQMWSENELLAWFNDDKVWTLVFWPDESLPSDREMPRSWMNGPVAGRLVSRDRRLDLLQMWDQVDAGPPGRAHINPNHVELCACGTLVTCDGQSTVADPEFFRTRLGISHAAAHSVVIVDDQGETDPAAAWHGTGEAFCDLPSLQMLRSDASGFYQPQFGVEQMRRTSLLIGDRLLVMNDRFFSRNEHTYRWQLMLRPELECEGAHARQRLREGVLLEYATPHGKTFASRAIRDYPPGLEMQTRCLSLTHSGTGSGTFTVAARAREAMEVVREIGEGWNIAIAPDLPPDLCRPGGTHSLCGESLGGDSAEMPCWFGRTVTLDEQEAAVIRRLSLSRAQVDRLEVYVNGHQAPALFSDPSITPGRPRRMKSEGRYWPSHFDLSGLLVAGENTLVIVSSVFRAQTICGPIRLLTPKEPPSEPLRISETHDFFTIEDGQRRWTLAPGNPTGALRTFPGGLTTDADTVLIGEGSVALAGVKDACGPGWSFRSAHPVDLEIAPGRLELVFGAEATTPVAFGCGDRWHQIGRQGWIDTPPDDPALTVRASEPLWSAEADRSALTPQEPEFPESDRPDSPVGSPYDPFPAGSPDTLAARVRAALDHPDWRTRVGAVELAMEHRLDEVVPRLIEMLREENRADLQLAGLRNWTFAKMKTRFLGWTTGTASEEMKRGHRLKTVLVEALGRFRAHQAIGLIGEILERQTDFYPTLRQACIAAERLEAVELLPALRALENFRETNVRHSARELVRRWAARAQSLPHTY